MLTLNLSGQPLITKAAPSGIVSYEFAGDVGTAAQIIDSWDEIARIYAGFNLGLDYLYLLLYSTTIAMALLWLTADLAYRRITGLVLLLAWVQWLAAVLDALENYALFTMLVSGPADPWPQVAWWSAAIKFSLVLAGLLVVLVAGLVQLLTRLTRSN
jgi:hypothetical protein